MPGAAIVSFWVPFSAPASVAVSSADGRLINAAGGFAGEWGHGPALASQAGNPPVAIPAYPCGCGQKGCVDTVGGARGLERLHKTLHDLDLSSQEIIDDWLKGEAKATRTIDVFVDLVASPLALTINITGATIVPVGGGLSNVEPLLAELDKAVRQRILRKFDRPLVVRSECRIEPGLIGAGAARPQSGSRSELKGGGGGGGVGGGGGGGGGEGLGGRGRAGSSDVSYVRSARKASLEQPLKSTGGKTVVNIEAIQDEGQCRRFFAVRSLEVPLLASVSSEFTPTGG